MDRLCIRKDFGTTARKNWPRTWTSDTRVRGGVDWLGIWKENYRQIERVRGKWVRNIRDNPAKNGAAWNLEVASPRWGGLAWNLKGEHAANRTSPRRDGLAWNLEEELSANRTSPRNERSE